MTIKGMVFDEKKAAGERLMLACKEMPNADMMLLGTYRGFELNIRFDSFKNEHGCQPADPQGRRLSWLSDQHLV